MCVLWNRHITRISSMRTKKLTKAKKLVLVDVLDEHILLRQFRLFQVRFGLKR